MTRWLADDEPPTVAERYGLATQSSHLRVEGRCRGDADYLIAAGLLAEPVGETGPRPRALAAALYRLRTEFDAARASTGPMNRTEMYLVLSQLKTLREARDGIGVFAVALATRIRFMQDDAAVGMIAGRVLDVWLDPTCQSCDGRGFNGGHHRGERKIACGGCRGTGERRALLGDTGEEKRFARALLDHLGAMLNDAEEHLRRKLRADCA